MTLRAPAARAMTVLDRSLFHHTIALAAATVADNRLIAKYRRLLQRSHDLLDMDRVDIVRPWPPSHTQATTTTTAAAAQSGSQSPTQAPDRPTNSSPTKCLLLRQGIQADVPSTWGPVVEEGVAACELGVVPYQLDLDYDYWSYVDVMASILPEDLHDELPTGFNTVGHIVHLNLRDRYLPYKHVIAQVLLDKNAHVRTVINKIDTVGAESEFRTFAYEVLATLDRTDGGGDEGLPDLAVEVRENNCVFRFDYAKVYWNSKLETEHSRLLAFFQPGQVVCDVMAGIGPFAVPAGRKHVHVWANDKNPESAACLEAAVARNKVQAFVRPFNEDGRTFIRDAADRVWDAHQRGEAATIRTKVKPAVDQNKRQASSQGSVSTRSTWVEEKMVVPPVVHHYVMNLPASATTFLHHFRGLYAGKEAFFATDVSRDTVPPYRLPWVHVHCFAIKGDDAEAMHDVRQRIHEEIGVWLTPYTDDATDTADPRILDRVPDDHVFLHDVRDVAPKKRMFCATFRLSRSVAFATRE